MVQPDNRLKKKKEGREHLSDCVPVEEGELLLLSACSSGRGCEPAGPPVFVSLTSSSAYHRDLE